MKVFSIVLGLLIILCAFLWPYLPENDPITYLDFADKRNWWLMPNAADVLSNLGFLLAGLYGLYWTCRRWKEPAIERPYLELGIVLSLACLMTSFGSAYFHWRPSFDSLFWDRLPMTLAFSSIIALLLTDRLNVGLGRAAMAILLPLGLLTVVGWHYDLFSLRPYIVLQFGCLVLVLVMSLLFRPNKIPNKVLWPSLGFYVLAKFLELGDKTIFHRTAGMVSGHTLKHLVAAVATVQLLTYVRLIQERSYTTGLNKKKAKGARPWL